MFRQEGRIRIGRRRHCRIVIANEGRWFKLPFFKETRRESLRV